MLPSDFIPTDLSSDFSSSIPPATDNPAPARDTAAAKGTSKPPVKADATSNADPASVVNSPAISKPLSLTLLPVALSTRVNPDFPPVLINEFISPPTSIIPPAAPNALAPTNPNASPPPALTRPF